MDWIHPVAGLGVGLVVGLTGVGGGALMTPILVLLFGMAPATAVGTDLWFAAVTKMFGGALHHSRGSVDLEVLRLLCIGSLPAACLTLYWLHSTGASQMKQGVILNLLGAVLVLTAGAMV
ncbi:MAG TPA: sulfite exporter TauE/SafE family protein, partial [Rubrivivax sp.]